MNQSLKVFPDINEEIQDESSQYPIKASELGKGIKDDVTYQAAASFLMEIKGFEKKVCEHYDDDISKAHSLHKSLTTKKNNALAPLKEAEQIIKPSLSNYNTEQDTKRKEEQDRLMAEQKTQDGDSPIVIPWTPKTAVAGISYSTLWKSEVTDMLSLVKAVAAGQAPLSLLMINTSVLGTMAKSLKSELKYPGVRTWAEQVVSSRGK